MSTDPPAAKASGRHCSGPPLFSAAIVFGLHFCLLLEQKKGTQPRAPRAKCETPHEWKEARGREKPGLRILTEDTKAGAGRRSGMAARGLSPSRARPASVWAGDRQLQADLGRALKYSFLFIVLSRILRLGYKIFKGKERIRGNLGPR